MKSKKRLAAEILKVSPKKIKFAPDALEDIQKAITRSDIRGLIAVGKIFAASSPFHSRAHARLLARQKKKGRRRGHGSHKGTRYAQLSQKQRWILQVRIQRRFLKLLRDKKLIAPRDFRPVYAKIKGGFFRNKRHLRLYLEENKLLKK